MSVSKTAGLFVILMAALVLLAGASTYWWPKTSGKVVNIETVVSRYKQGFQSLPEPYRKRGHDAAPTIAIERVVIRYTYDGRAGARVSERAAIWSEETTRAQLGKLDVGDSIAVSYMEWPVQLSVLIPGVPITAVAVLLLLGAVIFWSRELFVLGVSVVAAIGK